MCVWCVCALKLFVNVSWYVYMCIHIRSKHVSVSTKKWLL